MFTEIWPLDDKSKEKLQAFITHSLSNKKTCSSYEPSEFWKSLKSKTFIAVNQDGVMLHSGHNYLRYKPGKQSSFLDSLIVSGVIKRTIFKFSGLFSSLVNRINYLEKRKSVENFKFVNKDPYLGMGREIRTDPKIPHFLKEALELNAISVYGAVENLSYVQKGLEKIRKSKEIVFMELGAGAGETTLGLLELLKDSRAIICDLPETIMVAYTLISCFSKGSIKITLPHEWDGKYPWENKSRLLFITPEQLTLLPDNICDLFMNANSMQEMNIEVIEEYFREFKRLSKHGGIFYCKNLQYSKQKYTRANFDQYPWSLLGETIYEGIAPYSCRQHPEGGKSNIRIVKVK